MKIFLALALLFFVVAVLVSTWCGFYIYAYQGVNSFVALAFMATLASFSSFLVSLKALQ